MARASARNSDTLPVLRLFARQNQRQKASCLLDNETELAEAGQSAPYLIHRVRSAGGRQGSSRSRLVVTREEGFSFDSPKGEALHVVALPPINDRHCISCSEVR